MKKISRRVLKKISVRQNDEEALIQVMRENAKKDPAIQAEFKRFNIPVSEIDDVKIQFDDLDVSAKTKNMEIFINRALLKKMDDPTSYLVHELVHYLQQKTNHTNGIQKADYLDKDTEVEAFKAQVDYKKRDEGEEEAEQYVEELLSYHDIDGEEREEKKEELLGGK